MSAVSDAVVREYFAALARRDVEGMAALWAPDGAEHVAGQVDAIGPDGVRAYFGALFAAFPDLALTVRSTVAQEDRVAVHWTAVGTFVGPLWGLEPTGARIELEGIDLLRVADGLIVRNDAVPDSLSVARQIGLLPAGGSPAERTLFSAFNLRTRVLRRAAAARALERVADRVWLLRGGAPLRTMNVFLIEDEGGGVTLFDAGIAGMAGALALAAAPLGGINRVVLGHADADHRGAAPALGAPVLCHPDEREAAEQGDVDRYYRYQELRVPARWAYPRLLRQWDGGPVPIAGTVQEGDEVSGFEVVHLPGHAPGLIALFRERDRLALASDAFYALDVETIRPTPPRVPHRAFDLDEARARASLRRLAALEPATAWPGHLGPVTGAVRIQLERAAEA
jgi:steroid delta-isomerase-like uncharacterized protein